MAKNLAKIIVSMILKGGGARTTCTISTGIALAMLGFKVLLVDLDRQTHMSAALGFGNLERHHTTLAAHLGQALLEDAAPIDPREGLIRNIEGLSVDLMPGSRDLAAVEIGLTTSVGINRETVLRSYLDGLKSEYDYILIDAPTAFGMLILNALVAADSVIVPVNSEFLAANSIGEVLSEVNKTRKHLAHRGRWWVVGR